MSTIDVPPDVLPVKETPPADIMPLDLDLIRTDEAIQTREVRKGDALNQLRKQYREDPEAVPPIVVFRDEAGEYWLADGHYRLQAAREALSTEWPQEIHAEVRFGTKRDAFFYAAGANKHGKPLSSAEKRLVVERLLQDPEWGHWTDREISRHTGTSHVLVGKLRKALERDAALSGNTYQMNSSTRTAKRKNTIYTIDTTNIGKAARAPITASLMGGKGMEAVVTEGLDQLQDAWRAATPAARRAFRQWLATQPVDDLPVGTSSEETQRYNSVIADVCHPATQPEAAAPHGVVSIPDVLVPPGSDASPAQTGSSSMRDTLPLKGVSWIANKNILTPTGGFLKDGYTHTLNASLGCAFAGSLCGLYCYAQHNTWITKGRPWGLYGVKQNLREAYRREYDQIKRPRRGTPRPLKIYMSSSTDPYIPQEKILQQTLALLEEMVERPPDVLVIQTRNPLIQRDLAVIQTLSARCDLWVSVTVETDMERVPGFPPHASPPRERLKALQAFRQAGVQTQATISPLMPLADPEAFARQLDAACVRVIVDHYLLGDGAQGLRTKRTNFEQLLTQAGFGEWTKLDKLYEFRDLLASVLGEARVLVSAEGFNAVGSRRTPMQQQ